jgi:hypothetical protein
MNEDNSPGADIMNEDGVIHEQPETLFFPCSPKVAAEILAALRRQAEDRIVRRLVESSEGVDIQTEGKQT